MFNPSRDQARRFFIDAWHKHLQGLPQTQMECLACDIVRLHPEYHRLLGDAQTDPAEVLAREWTPEHGEANPFLHLSLHLAVEEQLSIDQPPGLRGVFNTLLSRRQERHDALHEVIECLGETLWRAQRDKTPPDAAAYLDSLRRRL